MAQAEAMDKSDVIKDAMNALEKSDTKHEGRVTILSKEEEETYNALSGRQKCAIILTILGEEVASNVFSNLDELEIEEITKTSKPLG